MCIKKGNPVEFTREHRQTYTIGGDDSEYGIAIDNERKDGSVMVELADSTIYHAKHIHAYAWAGWIPEELEPVFTKRNPSGYDGDF